MSGWWTSGCSGKERPRRQKSGYLLPVVYDSEIESPDRLYVMFEVDDGLRIRDRD